MNKFLISLALTMGFMMAQGATRPVNVSWVYSVPTGVTGATISVGTAATGPWTQIACTGVVPGSTCIPGSTASTTAYVDTQTVGSTIFYQIVAVAAACTPTTPATQVCGKATGVVVSTTVPPFPIVSTVVAVVP